MWVRDARARVIIIKNRTDINSLIYPFDCVVADSTTVATFAACFLVTMAAFMVIALI